MAPEAYSCSLLLISLHFITFLSCKSILSMGLKICLTMELFITRPIILMEFLKQLPGTMAISTGTCPKDHGAIANDWIGPNGEDVEYAERS